MGGGQIRSLALTTERAPRRPGVEKKQMIYQFFAHQRGDKRIKLLFSCGELKWPPPPASAVYFYNKKTIRASTDSGICFTDGSRNPNTNKPSGESKRERESGAVREMWLIRLIEISARLSH